MSNIIEKLKLQTSHYIKWVVGYFLLLFGAIWACINWFSMQEYWAAFDFLIWDAKHVYSIVHDGYNSSTCAFFPLFPYFWKILQLSPTLISGLNFFIFVTAAVILFKHYSATKMEVLLGIGFPSLLFMILPYSEALLYLISVLFLLALNRKNLNLAVLMLFLMSLTKPTVAVFLPAIFLVEYLNSDQLQYKFRQLTFSLVAVLTGNFLVFWIQKQATGNWFDFFQAQSDWGNRLRWPEFPLSTWSAPQVIWIDAFAFWVCMFSTALLIYFFLLKFKSGKSISRALGYSLIYLAGTGWFVLFFRGGSLFSLNRFVLATPFVWTAMIELKRMQFGMNHRKLIWVGAVSFFVVSLIFGSFLHIKTLLLYLLLDSLVVSWLIGFFNLKYVRVAWFVVPILVAIQIFYALVLLKGGWLA